MTDPTIIIIMLKSNLPPRYIKILKLTMLQCVNCGQGVIPDKPQPCANLSALHEFAGLLHSEIIVSGNKVLCSDPKFVLTFVNEYVDSRAIRKEENNTNGNGK